MYSESYGRKDKCLKYRTNWLIQNILFKQESIKILTESKNLQPESSEKSKHYQTSTHLGRFFAKYLKA